MVLCVSFLDRSRDKVLTGQVVPNGPFRNTEKAKRKSHTSFQETNEGVLFFAGVYNLMAISPRVYLPNAGFHGVPVLGSPEKCYSKLPRLWFWWNGPIELVIRLVQSEQS